MTKTRRWAVLGVVLMGTFMAILDFAIVNVAVPSIRANLRATYGEIEFVVSAYTLTYACLLVTGGRLGDRYGRKLLFNLGLTIFGAASFACGWAPTVGILIGARAVQGIGSALMYPQVLAIIQVTFDGNDRTRALGIFGSVIGIAAVAGNILGGALIALDIWHLEWRPIFLINVPLALATIIAAAFILPKEENMESVGLDWIGVGLVTTGLFLLVVPLLEGRDFGWPIWLLASLLMSAPFFMAFVWYEQRFARNGGRPLVRIDLFQCKSFAIGVPIAAIYMAAFGGFLFTFAIYLQVGLGFSALESGLTYVPCAVGFFIGSLVAPSLIPLFGRIVLMIGYLAAAFGLAATATAVYAAGVHLHGFELTPALVVAGLGLGFGLSPLVGTVISGLSAKDAGAGAGVVTTTLQVGNVLGVAIIGMIFFEFVGDAPPGATYPRTLATTLSISVLLLLFGAILVRRLPRTPFEVGNALVERLPGWSAGFAYSMFLMTGGRLADTLVHDLVTRVGERRIQRTHEAPQQPGEFLAFHFQAGQIDLAWLHYLMREALVFGSRRVPEEDARMRTMAAQIQEIRDRQAAHLLPTDHDAGYLRLLGFALASYPRMLPQVTRMATGTAPDSAEFRARWSALLRDVGTSIAEFKRPQIGRPAEGETTANAE
jgi:EmrB/QacA subfamily drug resistance transporter